MTFEKISMWINKKNGFTLITKLLKLVCVMQSSTSTCERKFSALNFIKNKLRNRLGDEFLDDLLLDFLEKDLVNKILKDTSCDRKLLIHSEILEVDQQIIISGGNSSCECITLSI